MIKFFKMMWESHTVFTIVKTINDKTALIEFVSEVIISSEEI